LQRYARSAVSHPIDHRPTRRLLHQLIPAFMACLPALVAALILAACGGGSSSDSGAASAASQKPATTSSEISPGCSGCAALSPTQYAGSGVGIWEKTNTTGAPMDVPVYIQGLNGQTVTLVFSNESADTSAQAAQKSAVASAGAGTQASVADASPHELAQEFNRAGWRSLSAQVQAKGGTVSLKTGTATMPALNDSRSWTHTDQSTHQLTLVAQRAAADGMVFNVWVENGYLAPGKVSQALVDSTLDGVTRSGGVYEALVSLGGPLWGAHSHPSWYLPPEHNWVDIVLLDFHSTGSQASGYFWGLNNYLQSAAPQSNESLGVVLDTASAARLGASVTLSDVAHELMHMQNFYRRVVADANLGSYDTWLEEMTAMMAEDMVSARLVPFFNSINQGRMPAFLAGNYNCPMLDFTSYQAGCESYSVAGTFGGFLVRQQGVAFVKDLLTRAQDSTSQKLLDASLKASTPGTSFGQAFRSFAVSADALIPPDAPAGYGFPARRDTSYPLIAINPADWASSRSLPTQLPTQVASYGSVPVVRATSGSFYSEVVRVPAGLTLSVVIH